MRHFSLVYWDNVLLSIAGQDDFICNVVWKYNTFEMCYTVFVKGIAHCEGCYNDCACYKLNLKVAYS